MRGDPGDLRGTRRRRPTLDKEVDCNQSSVPSPSRTPPGRRTPTRPPANGGIPAGDQYLGYQAVGLSSDYRPVGREHHPQRDDLEPRRSRSTGASAPAARIRAVTTAGSRSIGGQGRLPRRGDHPRRRTSSTTTPGPGRRTRYYPQRRRAEQSEVELHAAQPPVATRSTPPPRQRRPAPPSTRSRTTQAPRRTAAAPATPPTATASLETVLQDIASSSETFFNQPTSGDLTAGLPAGRRGTSPTRG